MSTPAFEEFVTIGRIVRPQGRHGEVIVEVLSDREDRFPRLRQAYVRGASGEPRAVAVSRAWPHKGRYVLKLEGVDTIDQAESFRGLELRIPEAELAVLPPGSYYHHELKGLGVSDERGRDLGTIVDILETGAGAPVIVVRGPEGETLLPLIASLVRNVDRANRRVHVAMPEWVQTDA